jgi:hypothetical protein
MAPATSSPSPAPPKPVSPPAADLAVSDEPDEEVEILDVGKAVKKDLDSDLVVVPSPVPQYSAANSQEAPQVPESPETVAIPQAEVPKGQKTEAQRLAEQRLIFEEEKRKSKEAPEKNVYLRGAAPGGIEDLEEEILRDIPSPCSPQTYSSSLAAKPAPQSTAFGRPMASGGAAAPKGGKEDEAYEELMDLILDELQDVSVK